MTEKTRPIVILGPTAGGKSELAAALAQALDGQIIGADSMQVYRHMDAGTAKPPRRLRKQVAHHLIDIVEPTQRFTVANWLQRADAVILQLRASGIRPIIVGGTNLYMKALLEGLFEGPPADAAFRQQLLCVPGAELHQRLGTVDPATAQKVHPNDRKKLVRALEVYHATGQPISQLQRQWDVDATSRSPCYRHHPILIGLDWPVQEINHRINLRVKSMFYPHSATNNTDGQRLAVTDNPESQSLPEEVARLHGQGLLGPQARQALGYQQVLAHLQGVYSLEQAYEKTKILTRRFAKTQRTWLRRFRTVKWVAVAHRPPAQVLEEIVCRVTTGK